MQRIGDVLVVSPSDLVGFLECGHLTALDLEAARGLVTGPVSEEQGAGDGGHAVKGDVDDIAVLQRRGLEHEAAYLDGLRRRDLTVRVIDDPDGIDGLDSLRAREAETVAAMRAGVDVVFQATFFDERTQPAWRGHADFLMKTTAVPSDLGPHSYEPEDTKLARRVKTSAVLQLCEYATQIERIQGVPPEELRVVLGTNDVEVVRLVEVASYHRRTRDRFLAALRGATPVYPVPVSHCPLCRWQTACENRREADDHLCRVAKLTREQARKLADAGVPTLTALAESTEGLRVKGIGEATLSRLQRQARLQLGVRPGDPLPFEPLVADEGLGLASLPEPDPGDLFYDIEGDPHVGLLGIEYLHGFGWEEGDTFEFRPFWAHTEAEEKRAFEQLIDFVTARRRAHPAMHVYHYAAYEITALRKLMGRHGTREDELDDLLRGEVFVDLYRVVRQGVAVGTPSYSIKKLEPLYMDARKGDITDAGSSIVEYERWLDETDPVVRQEILDGIEEYNREDVESTWQLRDWLEARRADLVDAGHHVPRPTIGDSVEQQEARPPSERDVATDALAGRLLDGLPDDVEDPSDDQRARRLMADLLRWHQREAKPEWWSYFERINRLDDDDLVEDSECIGGLELVGQTDTVKKSLVWTYTFDADQEHKLSVGTNVVDPAAQRRRDEGEAVDGVGTIVALDSRRGTLDLKRVIGSNAPHPTALVPDPFLPIDPLRDSLLRLGEAVLGFGVDGDGPSAAARQMLGRRRPRVAGVSEGAPLRHEGEDTLTATVRLARGLSRSVLPIQGPPGSGKTYTAARMICALVADGHKVGVTANSHAVITNVIDAVARAAVELDAPVRIVQKVARDASTEGDDGIVRSKNNSAIADLLDADEVDVAAGTAWLFAAPELQERLHTLVVDEAGQLSLANVMAVAPAAENLVLVGDPQQLGQPSKGTHPAGAGVSGLDHVLRGDATIADDRGLFLDRTWRLHPDITGFVSEQVYEGRLVSEAHCAGQSVADGPVVGGTGLRWLPVEHEGNRTSSSEEAAAVVQVHAALLGRPWADADGTEAPIGIDDILVVAPYNAQVRLLAESLPDGARVGTVDKFQGQEAPVVLVSLAASSADDAPRGMEFLYSRNRLNVAVSRAKALSVMVAQPALLSVRCRTVDQMRLANVLCRYVELAEEVTLPS